jgi:hypothetical protein
MTVDDENAALTMSEFAAIDETLADFADYYPSMVLNWEISPNNGLTWFSPGNGSTSTNTVFVTLANPNQIGGGLMQNAEVPVLHTTLSAVADEVRGSTSVAALVTNAFFNFTLRNITRADGTAMTYWQSWDVAGIASRPDGLLQTADGNCVSWATFFVDVLRAWGADFSYAANVRQVVVDHQNSPVNATEFLVNNWAFGNQNVLVPPPPRLAGYSWYNEFGEPFAVNTVNGMRYNWQGQPAVTYLGGSAQNNPNPMADFSDHVFVRIGNVIYDPSYGVTYDPNLLNPTDDDLLRAFQTDAVAGSAWFPPVQGAIGAPRVYFRPTTIPNVPDVKLKFRNLF